MYERLRDRDRDLCGSAGGQGDGDREKLGKVEVDVGDSDCKVPVAAVYIEKSRRGAPVAAKRKTVRC